MGESGDRLRATANDEAIGIGQGGAGKHDVVPTWTCHKHFMYPGGTGRHSCHQD